jgi:hypothetical protein
MKPAQWLFGFFRSNPQGDASVNRHCFKLDIETVAVGVLP